MCEKEKPKWESPRGKKACSSAENKSEGEDGLRKKRKGSPAGSDMPCRRRRRWKVRVLNSRGGKKINENFLINNHVPGD